VNLKQLLTQLIQNIKYSGSQLQQIAPLSWRNNVEQNLQPQDSPGIACQGCVRSSRDHVLLLQCRTRLTRNYMAVTEFVYKRKPKLWKFLCREKQLDFSGCMGYNEKSREN